MNPKTNLPTTLDGLAGWRIAEGKELRYISGRLYAMWSVYNIPTIILSIFSFVTALIMFAASLQTLLKQQFTLVDLFFIFLEIIFGVSFFWLGRFSSKMFITNLTLKYLLVQKKLSIRVLDVSIREVGSAKVLVRDMNNSQYASALDYITYGKYIIPERGILIKADHPDFEDFNCFVLPCYEEGSTTDLQLKEFYKKYKPRRFVKK